MEQNRNDTHDLQSLSGTKMYKDLENTKLTVSLFQEKQKIKVRLFFKYASFKYSKWLFLENTILDIYLYKSSNWVNWLGHMLIDASMMHLPSLFSAIFWALQKFSYKEMCWSFSLIKDPRARFYGRRIIEAYKGHAASELGKLSLRASEKAMVFIKTKLA